MIISVASGKGGTGKTSLIAAFASLAESKVLCDGDVDAADLHLIMNPEITKRHDFISGHTASIDQSKCTQCVLCRELCRWDAINADFVGNPIGCEGCGVCYYLCPDAAINFHINNCGQWFISKTRFGPMAHARLAIAEENSGKLVSLIRQEGKKIAQEQNLDLLLTDGPPDVGCPVIASLGGATAVLIVTEPTLSGRHDMERVAELAAFFKVPAMICINKYDLNPTEGQAIEALAEEKNISVLGRVLFDPSFTRAMIDGKTIVEFDSACEGSRAVTAIWENLIQRI